MLRQENLMKNDRTYLDSYTLQQDLLIRLPKSILTNLDVKKGMGKLNFFFDAANKAILLIPKNKNEVSLEKDK